MVQAVVCDRKGEVVATPSPGKLTVTLTDGRGMELISAVGFDLCGPCVEMCYKIIADRLLPHLMEKKNEVEGLHGGEES